MGRPHVHPFFLSFCGDRGGDMSIQTVVIDPPWNERGGGKSKRGADKHYPLLSTPEIVQTIYSCEYWNQIEPHAHLYMWVTNNFLIDGLEVVKALGFTYKTNFVWLKNSMGLGQYFRGQHEICLFATRGSRPTQPRTDRRDISSVLIAPKSRHSEKPLSSYDLIESRSKGRYLEIFARRKISDQWIAWGNEINDVDTIEKDSNGYTQQEITWG